jgi:hypothetical protein
VRVARFCSFPWRLSQPFALIEFCLSQDEGTVQSLRINTCLNVPNRLPNHGWRAGKCSLISEVSTTDVPTS